MERVSGYSMIEVLWAMASAAAATVYGALQAYGEARGREAAARELRRLSDHTLRDIGLHRSQIDALVHGDYYRP
jgi:uncharacterized protein YjiS (DUF1127 family)